MVTTIEKILTKNVSVCFTPEFKINTTHFFGNLEVLTSAGKVIELRDVILSIKLGCLTYNHEFSQGSNLYTLLSNPFSCNNLSFFFIISDLKIGRTTNFRRFESQVRQSSFAVKNNQISESVNILDSNDLAALPTLNSYPENPYTQVTECHQRNLLDFEKAQQPTLRLVESGPPYHLKDIYDVAPSPMACVGSLEHRKFKQPAIVQTNTLIIDHIARLRIRNEIANKMLTQFDRTANQSREPQAATVNTSLSSDRPQRSDRSSLEQNVNVLHKVSKSRKSSTSDDLEQSSSGSSRTLRRSALSLARSRCPPKQSKKINQMNEKWWV